MKVDIVCARCVLVCLEVAYVPVKHLSVIEPHRFLGHWMKLKGVRLRDAHKGITIPPHRNSLLGTHTFHFFLAIALCEYVSLRVVMKGIRHGLIRLTYQYQRARATRACPKRHT